MRERVTRRRITGLSLVLIVMATLLAVGGVASAQPKNIIAGPGAVSLGYLTKNVTIKKGQKATFRNLDTAPHDVKSDGALFKSNVITFGKSSPVNNVNKLAKGKYGFHCSIHPFMKGTLTVK